MNKPMPRDPAPDRRRPSHDGLRRAVGRLRLAAARASGPYEEHSDEITAFADHLIQCLRQTETPAVSVRVACPCCGRALLVTVADGICTVEGRE